jgi:hypothetical protein
VESALKGEIMKTKTILHFWKTSSIKQKLLTVGILALLSLGALGAMGEFSDDKQGGILSGIAETIGLKEKSSSKGDSLNETLTPPNGTLQLSKEYVYAGSRMVATEDYGVGSTSQNRTNVALATNGATASASTELTIEGRTYPVSAIVNGDRKGVNWESTGGWADATPGVFPDWVQVNFNGTKLIDEINVFTIQDNYQNPIEPNESMTFGAYGVMAFEAQYWNGSAWQTIPNGIITNNNKVWRKLLFAPVPTSSIRILTNVSTDVWSRLIEVEAFGVASNTTVPPPPISTPTPTPPPANGCPSGFESLGGHITSDPAVSVFKNKIYAFVRGSDNGIYYNVSDGNTFNWGALGGWLLTGPASLADENFIYVEATGGDNNRYYRKSADGVNFNEWVGGSSNTYTASSTASFNGHTYTFVKGTGNAPPLCYKKTASANNVTYVRRDNTTQGNWMGVYGNEGFQLTEIAPNLPGWAQIALNGNWTHTWASSTSDVRGLQKPANPNDRIAATWYTPNGWDNSQYSINFNFTDGQTHRLAIYALDWDFNNGRSLQLEIVDATTGEILNTQNVTSYSNGAYLVWNVKGQVTVKVRNGGSSSVNGVISGVFIDNPNYSPQPPATPTIASVTPNADPTCLNIAINPVNGAASYNVKLTLNGYTINVLQTNFPWCGLTPNTYFEYQAQAVNNIGASGWSAPVGGTTAAPAQLSATVTASPTNMYQGDYVSVTWSTNQPRPTSDYLALYRGNMQVATQNISGGTTGTTGFEMTLIGTYTVRYFVQGNPNPVAISNSFTVTRPPRGNP